MGMFSGNSTKKYIHPLMGNRAKGMSAKIYEPISRGLRGQGLYPEITERTKSQILNSLKSSYQDSQTQVNSLANRFLPSQDAKMRGYLNTKLQSDYYRNVEGVKDEYANYKYEDKQAAMDMALATLASERKIGATYSDAYMQSESRRAQMPTGLSTTMGGIGSALGWLAGSADGGKSVGQNIGSGQIANPAINNLNNPSFMPSPQFSDYFGFNAQRQFSTGMSK